MAIPISVQLYSLRNLVEERGIDHVLEEVAKIGYVAVEPAGFFEHTPDSFRAKVESLGMVVSGSHRPWCRPDNLDEAVAIAKSFGLDCAAGGYGPDQFADVDAIAATCAEINTIIAGLKPHGLSFFIHNHAWEFERIDGRLKYDIVAEACPDLLFEIDTYWAANFGAEDPAEMVKTYGRRAHFLHIKDGPLVKGEPNVAVGSGRMDIAKVVAAADPAVTRYLIVELDSCGTDMLTAVADSYRYLIGEGLASGRV